MVNANDVISFDIVTVYPECTSTSEVHTTCYYQNLWDMPSSVQCLAEFPWCFPWSRHTRGEDTLDCQKQCQAQGQPDTSGAKSRRSHPECYESVRVPKSCGMLVKIKFYSFYSNVIDFEFIWIHHSHLWKHCLAKIRGPRVFAISWYANKDTSAANRGTAAHRPVVVKSFQTNILIRDLGWWVAQRWHDMTWLPCQFKLLRWSWYMTANP
jgi:hypothetical protein